MRLKRSLAAATEDLMRLLNEGYAVIEEARTDYHHRQNTGTFNPERENPTYEQWAHEWGQKVVNALNAIFPSSLEANYFLTQQTGILVSTANIPPACGSLIMMLPDYINRLRYIFESHLHLYTDLPIQDRLYVEDIDSFHKVRDVNPAMVSHFITNGYLAIPEDKVQTALEQILEVPFHRKDWGGEINDLCTTNVVVNGVRRSTAFLLKGPGIGKKVMEIADCGRRGDQIVRLFDTPADLFVVQYVGPIADLLIKDVQGKVANLRAIGRDANFLIMDAQDTARVLHAYGKL